LYAKAFFQLCHAAAQLGFRDAQRALRGRKPTVLHHLSKVIELIEIREFHCFLNGTLKVSIVIYSDDCSKYILIPCSGIALNGDSFQGDQSCSRIFWVFMMRRVRIGWAMVFRCVRCSAILITATP